MACISMIQTPLSWGPGSQESSPPSARKQPMSMIRTRIIVASGIFMSCRNTAATD
jgi:hypothetical protein